MKAHPRHAYERPTRSRWELFALLELWALCGLAIAQPVLDITGRAPDFFLFHGAERGDILLLVTLITVGPPVLLWLLGIPAKLAGRRIRRAVHLLTVGVLCAVLAIEAGKWLSPLRGVPLVLGAVLVAGVAATAYLRWPVSARVLRVAAIGPLVFVVLFVFNSPTSGVVLGRQHAALDRQHLALGSERQGAGAGAPAHAEFPPIVMLVLDEFPQVSLLDDAGRIDPVRFPNFARLAQRATWYRNATAVTGFTPYAVPSMLTGRFPTRRAAPHYSRYPENVFTLLGPAYDIKARESIVALCPPPECGTRRTGTALPELLGKSASLLKNIVSPVEFEGEPMSEFVEPVGDGGAGPPKPKDVRFRWKHRLDNQPARFTEFLDGLRPSTTPTLHFLHMLLPHQPFRYLPSGTRYTVSKPLPVGGGWWAQLTRERHLLQAQYTDRLLGMALKKLHDTGLYDDALLIVTADHGIGFNPDLIDGCRTRNTWCAPARQMGPGQSGAAEVAWVPLFIKAPGQQTGEVDGRNWLQVDLLPTVADYAGVRIPWRVDGISALREPRRTSAKPFYPWEPGPPPVQLETTENLAKVLGGPDDAVGLPPVALPQLTGRTVSSLPIGDAGRTAEVANESDFHHVDPGSGVLPALVHGDLSARVPAGTNLAIAVNGTIGAVVPVLPATPGLPRFAGLIKNEQLFRPGANRLELFLIVEGSRPSLRRLRL